MQVISKVLCSKEDFQKKQKDIFHDIVNHLLNTFPDKDIEEIKVNHRIQWDKVETVGTITYKDKRNG